MGIFKRLRRSYIIITAVLVAVFATMFSFYLRYYTINTQADMVRAAASAVERWTGGMHIEENDIRARTAFKMTLNEWKDLLHADIVIFNNNGQRTEATADISGISEQYLKSVSEGKVVKTICHIDGLDDDKMYLLIGMPIYYQNTIIGSSFYVSGIPVIYKTATELTVMFIIAGLITLALAAVMVYTQSKKISRPIIMINDAVRDIAAGNFSERVPVESNDEIGQLASSFNFMAENLGKMEEKNNTFVSDVSHELRTPMTSISGFIEGILDGTIPKDKEEYYLKIVLDETRRLTKFVNDTLEMSKMSTKNYQLDIDQFDINELVRTCIISLESRIEEKNLELNVDFKHEVLNVLADKDSIKRVILNIMDNAIKFSYPNTTIGISVWTERGKAYVCIGNFGDGIDSADLSNVFERYYKTDRSRKNEKSGAGLGLSMVKNILVLHKQSIWVESVDTKEGSNAKYTKFTFTLEKA
ncbi:MAG: HAMP domain-containing sensor histidine kinase [Clostridiales bacterium]|nr:HAMP domain-containing sensor histidine kinase [Clostridiales bacterium]